MNDIIKIIADAKKQDEVIKTSKMEHLRMAIEAVNLLTETENAVLQFLNDNKEKLIGKKLFLSDGSKSKVFAAVLKDSDFCKSPVFACYFKRGNIAIRACINGGSYDDRTYYCQYFDRNLYNVFAFDSEDKCTSIRVEKSSYKIMDIKQVLSTLTKIKELKAEGRKIHDKIMETEKLIAYDLLEII